MTNRRISDLIGPLPDPLLESVEPMGDPGLDISADRIRSLALSKLRDSEGKQARKRRAPIKFMLIAAVLCVLTLSAIANWDSIFYFRSYFGDSADIMADRIVTPDLAAQYGDIRFAVEALVFDGRTATLFLSITDLTGAEIDLVNREYTEEEARAMGLIDDDWVIEDPHWFYSESILEIDSPDMETSGCGYSLMTDISSPDRAVYCVQFIGRDTHERGIVTVQLVDRIAPITLSIDVSGNISCRTATLDIGDDAVIAEGSNYLPRQLQVTSLGYSIIGTGRDDSPGMPYADLSLVFADGTVQPLHVRWGEPYERAHEPLVNGMAAGSDDEGNVSIDGSFRHFIDVDSLVAVSLDGVEYPLD